MKKSLQNQLEKKSGNVFYIPDFGDIIWLDLEPQAGKEIAKRRIGLVYTKKEFNRKTGFAGICPITNTSRGNPFEVSVQRADVMGVILTDQHRTLDWRARNAEFAVRADDYLINEVLYLLHTIIAQPKE